jgi:hypothetical protein
MKQYKFPFSKKERVIRFFISASTLLLGASIMYLYNDWTYLGGIIGLSMLPLYSIFLKAQRPETIKNMLYLLEVRGDYLRVGMEQIPIDKLKRVAVGPLDKEFAVLQFPYNPMYQIDYSFPIQQLNDVRAWFRSELPDVELIE